MLQRSAHMNIASKINLISIPPILALAFLLLLIVNQRIAGIRDARSAQAYIEFALALDKVAHNFAVERGLTAGFLGSNGAANDAPLKTQRQNTDSAWAAFTQFQKKNPDIKHRFSNALANIEAAHQPIKQLRIQVDILDPQSKPFILYSTLNKNVLELINTLGGALQNINSARALGTYSDILFLKERAGQERGLANGLFASKQYPLEKMSQLYQFQQDQVLTVERLVQLLDDESPSFTKAVATNDEIIDNMRAKLWSAATSATELDVEAQLWFNKTTERINAIKAEADHQAADITRYAAAAVRSAWLSVAAWIALFTLGGGVLLFMSRTLSRTIVGNILALTKHINRLKNTLDFSNSLIIRSQDETGEAAQALNALCVQLKSAVRDVSGVMAKVAEGDFSEQVSTAYTGDLETLRLGVNNSANKVQLTMDALSAVMQALEQGEFGARMSDKVEGTFKNKVDRAMSALDTAFAEIGQVMQAMSKGDFSKRVHTELAGSLNTLKIQVNLSLDNVSTAINDITQVLLAQKQGDFSRRINKTYGGQLETLKITINDSMSSLAAAMNVLSTTFAEIDSGNFAHRVVAPMQGDLHTMKNTINSSLKKLDTAISEIINVAESQKRGELELLIDGDYSGDLMTLKNALNESGSSLNASILAIVSIMKSIEEGEFSQRLHEEMPGIFGVLKDATNASLEDLQSAVQDITSVANAQNQGELFVSMRENYRGDLKTISGSINSAMENLRNIVGNIQQAANNSMATTKELAQAFTELSRRTESQAAALEEVSSTMEEISATVANTEAESSVMATSIDHAMNASRSTLASIDATVDSMNQMKSSSAEIAQITAMIDEISFQTNLLALNAAVEAARAGEQGRGFAVVAGEVRNLAQRSSDAARNIRSLIDENLLRVNQSFELIIRSNEDLKSISSTIAESREITTRVVCASREQGSGIREVNSAISSLDTMTQENAAMVEETSAATKSVEDQTKSVHRQLAFFRLSG